eukprot:SAG22_NODE_4261_length_1325_cov_1.040783_1_plen_61_part_00
MMACKNSSVASALAMQTLSNSITLVRNGSFGSRMTANVSAHSVVNWSVGRRNKERNSAID